MLVTKNPTSNQTPDLGQGGDPVTGNSNTGHGQTEVDAADGSDQTKTCLWTGFSNVSGLRISAILKVDWQELNGSKNAGGSNLFEIAYSLNGGGAWTNFFQHIDVNGGNSGTAQVGLSSTQDLTQVRVRDRLAADTNNPGDTAHLDSIVSNIRIEITLADGSVMCGM